MNPRACRRFSRLANEAEDRDLSEPELTFVAEHRATCAQCRRDERSASMALNMLREAAVEEETFAPAFEDRVLRRARIAAVRDRLSYWSPAVIGAAIACSTLFAALHLASMPSRAVEAETRDNSARLVAPPTPSLDLDRLPDRPTRRTVVR